MAWPPVDQFTASKKSSGVFCRASNVAASARKYSSSIPKEYSTEDSSSGVLERIITWRLSPLRLSSSPRWIARSNPMCLQPPFEKRRLPEPRMSFRTPFQLGLAEHMFYELRAVYASVAGCGLRKDVFYEIQEGSAQITQRRDREIALRPVDNFGGHVAARSFLQHILASAGYFQSGGNACGQLYEVMIEEWHSRFQPERHAHVIYTFDRIVDQHDLSIELENLVDRRAGADAGEKIIDERAAHIFAQVVRAEQPFQIGMAPIEIAALIFIAGIIDAEERWIPTVAAENFVGALTALNHLDVLGHFLGQKVERHGVVTDHRLRHRLDGARQRGQRPFCINANLLVIGSEPIGNNIRVVEFIA